MERWSLLTPAPTAAPRVIPDAESYNLPHGRRVYWYTSTQVRVRSQRRQVQVISDPVCTTCAGCTAGTAYLRVTGTAPYRYSAGSLGHCLPEREQRHKDHEQVEQPFRDLGPDRGAASRCSPRAAAAAGAARPQLAALLLGRREMGRQREVCASGVSANAGAGWSATRTRSGHRIQTVGLYAPSRTTSHEISAFEQRHDRAQDAGARNR